MTKFAVSSSRGRRVPPFRRMRENTNKPDNAGNELIGPNVDQVTNLFLTYSGPTTEQGKPWPWFLSGWTFCGVIAGLARYRPPPAPYIIALTEHPPAQHRFHHGRRPMMTEADEVADGGVELYYSSPSFLLSAGGMFLNSGYGRDEFQGYKQVAVAQSTTLIPVRADATFAELIRFDPYPGDVDADGDAQLQRDAVNTGVHLGFACGANLEVPQRWPLLAGAAPDGPWLLLNLDAAGLGFYVAVYRTPVADPERLKVNYGTVPRNFGWLYAMEATAMPFDVFADRIRRRNTFPAKLDWDAKYTFLTPDEPAQAFEFWMRPDQFRYVPRIFKVDGRPVLVDGFTSLPLVDGPYLQSSGNEGRLEIRAPGQDPASAPLVLDYRQALNPVRIDNAGSWPQPFLDRARAVADFARRLLTMTPSRPDEAVATLRGFDPPASALLPHRRLFAQSLHMLTRQYIAGRHLDRARAIAAEMIQTGHLVAATPDADVAAVASSLLIFGGEVETAGLATEATAATQAATDLSP